jgi:hypothetical protein
MKDIDGRVKDRGKMEDGRVKREETTKNRKEETKIKDGR